MNTVPIAYHELRAILRAILGTIDDYQAMLPESRPSVASENGGHAIPTPQDMMRNDAIRNMVIELTSLHTVIGCQYTIDNRRIFERLAGQVEYVAVPESPAGGDTLSLTTDRDSMAWLLFKAVMHSVTGRMLADRDKRPGWSARRGEYRHALGVIERLMYGTSTSLEEARSFLADERLALQFDYVTCGEYSA